MDKIILALIFTVILCGCCPTLPAQVETVYVKVPVLECPANYTDAPALARPTLISPMLNSADAANPGRVVQACAIDSRQLLYYAEQLEARVGLADSMCSK